MTSRRGKDGGDNASKGEQGESGRPCSFEKDPGFKRSFKKLSPEDRAKLLPALQEFEKDWCNPSVTIKDLNTTWDYKALQGAPKNLNVKQIRKGRHRIALLVDGKEAKCVWYLEIFGKQSKNAAPITSAVERAEQIRRGRYE